MKNETIVLTPNQLISLLLDEGIPFEQAAKTVLKAMKVEDKLYPIEQEAPASIKASGGGTMNAQTGAKILKAMGTGWVSPSELASRIGLSMRTVRRYLSEDLGPSGYVERAVLKDGSVQYRREAKNTP